MKLLTLFVLVFWAANLFAEARKPRWPIPNRPREISSSSVVRIAEYKNYVKGLTASELKEFAQDARIDLGANGVSPSKIIVKFRELDAQRSIRQMAGPILGSLREVKTIGAFIIKLPESNNLRDVVAYLGAIKELEGVEYALPDYRISIVALPNDPDWNKQWSFKNTGSPGGFDINAPQAWDVTKGSSSTLVGVIDTGIDLNHPDLRSNLWTNPGEIGLDSNGKEKASNGIDDDGNGYVDDFRGWDFVSNDNNPQDGHGHGTHVAGVIGASGNNGMGIAGINWEVGLVPLRILDDNGYGSTSDAVLALEYALKNGITITNNSWGGGSYSSALEEMLKKYRDQNGLFVAAAGNNGSNNDQYPHYPSSYEVDNVISVAATTREDKLAGFSNYGKVSVHLAAPGSGIYSLFKAPDNYRLLSGTSMATPHVAGAAALMKSLWPSWSYSQIKAKLMETVDAIDDLSSKVSSGGRLNLARAVNGIPVSPPRAFTITGVSPPFGPLAGGTRITITGTLFDAGVKIWIGNRACISIQVQSAQTITCTTPSATKAALVDISGTNSKGVKKVLSSGFTYSNPPVLQSAKPAAGPVLGGGILVLKGSGFTPGAKVFLGSRECTEGNVKSAQEIHCVLPAGDPGSYSVLVRNILGQESQQSIRYTFQNAPQLTAINPSRVAPTARAAVSISGQFFISGAKVVIGGKECTGVKVVSPGQITCTAPTLAQGKYSLKVTNPDGQVGTSSINLNFEVVASRWVQTNGGNCDQVCMQSTLTPRASAEGAFCTSGKVIPSSARKVIQYTNGCDPRKTCVAQGPVKGARSVDDQCLGPRQNKNSDVTNITMGCFCGI